MSEDITRSCRELWMDTGKYRVIEDAEMYNRAC
jgi:hypothetical protein